MGPNPFWNLCSNFLCYVCLSVTFFSRSNSKQKMQLYKHLCPKLLCQTEMNIYSFEELLFTVWIVIHSYYLSYILTHNNIGLTSIELSRNILLSAWKHVIDRWMNRLGLPKIFYLYTRAKNVWGGWPVIFLFLWY